jgi:hypothetical protein
MTHLNFTSAEADSTADVFTNLRRGELGLSITLVMRDCVSGGCTNVLTWAKRSCSTADW